MSNIDPRGQQQGGFGLDANTSPRPPRLRAAQTFLVTDVAERLPMSCIFMLVGSQLCSLGHRVLVWGSLAVIEAQQPGRKGVSADAFNFLAMWLGFVWMNAVMPICGVYTLISSQVVWSGIR